jgi:hypothetical protein
MAKLPKRVGNVKRKERRAASWERGQDRKAARRNDQKQHEEINRQCHQRGEPTPAEARYAERRAYRRIVAALRKRFGTCVRSHPCYRPYGHKGKCGKLTQTEMRMAGEL